MSNGNGGINPDFTAAASDGKQEFFLSEELQAKFAARLNALINVPFLGEKMEGQIILKVVQSLDRNLFKFVPKEILDVALDKDKVLPGEVLTSLKENLPSMLAGLIPLPFIPRAIKEAVIARFISILLEALSSNKSLDELLDPA